MADVKWIKIVVDIFDDEKMLLIESLPDSDSIIVCWFKLLCLAGKQNNCGVLMLNDRIAYTDEMLATVFRRPVQTVRLALETFEQFGMIEIVNGTITIPNWEKHQNEDGLEKVRTQTRERVSRHREKQKMITECNVTGNVTVTECNATEVDKERDIEKELERDVDAEKREIPTLEEVKAFAISRNSNIDPLRFYSYYQAGGWKDPKGNPIGNWKQKFLKWENTEPEKKTAPATSNKNAKASCKNYPVVSPEDLRKSLDRI